MLGPFLLHAFLALQMLEKLQPILMSAANRLK